MNKIKGTMFLLLVAGVFSHAAVQKTVFSADVVASTCHVVVEADSSGNSGRLTFGTYRRSTGASVPPRDFTVRLYESGATVQGCSAFKAGQIATLDFGNPGQLDAGG
ncbi:TPA: fimbrial protein, partial [Escherichia coli]|nr:fimbrial protein [Escherichia coli]